MQVQKRKELFEELTDNNFMQSLHKSKKLSIVLFYKKYSGNCRIVQNELEKLKNSFGSRIHIFQFNIDNSSSVSNDLLVKDAPTLAFYKKENLVEILEGISSEKDINLKIINLL